MKIIITGADGQVGRSLARVLFSHTVVALTRTQLDITDSGKIEAVLEKHQPDIVLNAAAYTAVDLAETKAIPAFEINEGGPLALAILTAHRKIPLLHFSTDYVFDGTAKEPYTEYSTPNPMSLYGKSKLAGEMAVQKNNPQHFIVRTAWVYHEVGNNFPNTILGLAQKPVVRVVNDQTGSPTYAPHLAASVAKLITGAYPFGLYHLAGSGQTTWFDLTKALFQRMGILTPLVPVPTTEFPRPARRPMYSVLASTKAPELALPPWERGLDEFVEAVKSHERGKQP
jgi:dTDP-4-dehydrorhamnose reductase